MTQIFPNPFRPGAGHLPPYLAGRDEEKDQFRDLLQQKEILDNLVLTGLRGIGKTVLLDTLKPIAQESGWLWVGTDLSQSMSLTEEKLATRLLTDLASATAGLVVHERQTTAIGFAGETRTERMTLDYSTLDAVFRQTPGLVADKLKAVLELAWRAIAVPPDPARGVVFAYDEAQNLADHAAKEHFPLSLLLDTFQSLQKRGVRFMLVLAGLPTLFPKLVDARTFAERMFRVTFLRRLSDLASRDAILKPISKASCPVKLDEASVRLIIEHSAGYPYFIQFFCREVYDTFLANIQRMGLAGQVPIDAITRRLDSDFFAGRWSRVTDRQRDLLFAIANLRDDEEFTVHDVVSASKQHLNKAFSPSHANQMLAALATAGLVYKNRHGKYSFAVPLFGAFVLRQMSAG